MCSVLIFAKPGNDHPDPKLDWTKYKRGDVIDVRDEDNFFWGNDIHGPKPLGWWRVVVVPGVPAKDVISLAMSDPQPDDVAPYRLRVNKIDLDSLEQGKGLDVKDSLPTDKQTLLAARSVKPALTDPNVIGQDARIIG